MIGNILLILSIFCQLPTEKIQCGLEDEIIYVRCEKTPLVIKIFKEYNIEVKWEYKNKSESIISGKRNKKDINYKLTRDLFFKLAKQKTVHRIY